MMRGLALSIVCLLFLEGCYASRGAEGLGGGETAVSITAPLMTSVRIGVTDHIEYRQSLGLAETGMLHMADIYVHTHHEGPGFNAGATAGVMLADKVGKPFYGFTAGYTVARSASFYAALFSGAKLTTDQTVALGGQFTIPLDEQRLFTLIILPEVDHFITQYPSEMFGSTYGSLTIGMVADIGAMVGGPR